MKPPRHTWKLLRRFCLSSITQRSPSNEMARVLPSHRGPSNPPEARPPPLARAANKVSLSRVELSASQPLVLLTSNSRLGGGEGDAFVAMTLDARDAAGTTLAESLVPTLGRVHSCSCSFDSLSHATMPLHLQDECSELDDIVRDARDSVAVLVRLEQLYREMDKMVDDGTGDGRRPRTWEQLFGAYDLSRVDQLKALRELNDKIATHAQTVLAESSGPALVSTMLSHKNDRVEALLKAAQRQKLDKAYKNKMAVAESIPAQREQSLEEESRSTAEVVEARTTFAAIEQKMKRLIQETQHEFDALDIKLAENKRRRKLLDKEFVKVEAEAARMGKIPEALNERRVAIKEELTWLKSEVTETEAKHGILRKNVIDGPRKDLIEQQNRIDIMENAHQRTVEAIRKHLKKLDDRLKKAREGAVEIDERRIACEIDFRKEILEIISFDRSSQETALLNALLQKLRVTYPIAMRRYAPGQQLVLQLVEGDTVVWYDGIVEATQVGSFVHQIQLTDGRRIQLLLHPFNHAISHLPCATWDAVRRQYAQLIAAMYGTVRDPLSTSTRHNILAFNMPLERVNGQEAESCLTPNIIEWMSDACQAGAVYEGGQFPSRPCIVLTGPPGAGKSCLLQQLAVRSAQDQSLIPILVRVPDLQQRLSDHAQNSRFARAWNFVDAHLQCLRDESSQWDNLYPFLRQAMIARRAVLLIDGIDEAGSHATTIRRHVIEVLAAQGHTIVVTERPTAEVDAYPDTFERVRIMPPSAMEQYHLAWQRLGSTKAAEALLTYAEAHLPYDSAARTCATCNPLILAMMVSLYEQERMRQRDFTVGSLPQTTAALYGEMTRCVFDGSFSDEGLQAPVTEVLQVAAFHAHARQERVITEEQLEQAVRRTVLPVDMSRVLTAIKELIHRGHCSLLTMLEFQPLQFQFAHLSIQEYFFVVTACKGCAIPKRMERPWQWSTWWQAVLTLGISVGDSFGAGLLAGYHRSHIDAGSAGTGMSGRMAAMAVARENHLDLANKIGVLDAAPSQSDPLSLPDGPESSSRMSDRTIAIRGVAELIKSVSSLNLQRNLLNASDVMLLGVGVRPKLLTALNVSHNQFGDQGMKTLVNALVTEGSNSALRQLWCAHNQIGVDGALALAQLVCTSTALTALDVRGNHLEDEGLYALGMAMMRSKQCPLRFVRCDAIDLGENVSQLKLTPFLDATSTVTLLAGAIKNNTVLRAVSVVDAKISPEATSLLAAAMRVHQALTALSLTRTSLGDVGVAALARGLKSHGGLKSLVIDNCGVKQKGAKALATGLRGCSALSELGVRNDSIYDAGVSAISEAAVALVALTSIDFTSTGTSTTGFKPVAALIQQSATLTSVDVSRNSLDGIGMHAMGEAIKSSRGRVKYFRCEAFDLSEGITELRLKGRLLAPGAAPLLGGLAVNNSALVALDLQHNGIGPNGAEALALGVSRAVSLTELNVSHNYVEPTGCASLAGAIKSNRSIEVLDLSSNCVCGVNEEGLGRHTLSGVKPLAEAVSGSKLRVLVLNDNRLEVGGAKALAPALRSCRSLRRISLISNNLTFFGMDPSGVEALVTQATLGCVYTQAGDARKLDLTDNHLNQRALAWPPVFPPGTTKHDSSLMSIEAKRCSCHYCLRYDKEHPVSCLPSPRRASSSSTRDQSTASIMEARPHAEGRASGLLASVRALAETKLGEAIVSTESGNRAGAAPTGSTLLNGALVFGKERSRSAFWRIKG